MTISKIDNRLLWKCIFGTFKKSLVVSLILFLSFFLSSYLFLSYFFCHTRVRVRPIRCLVAGTRTRVLQRIQRVFSVRCLSFIYTFLFLLYVFLSRIFYFYLFFTLSIPYIICLILYSSKHVCPFSVQSLEPQH